MVELKLNKVLFLPLLSLYLPSSSYSAPTALDIRQEVEQIKVISSFSCHVFNDF